MLTDGFEDIPDDDLNLAGDRVLRVRLGHLVADDEEHREHDEHDEQPDPAPAAPPARREGGAPPDAGQARIWPRRKFFPEY